MRSQGYVVVYVAAVQVEEVESGQKSRKVARSRIYVACDASSELVVGQRARYGMGIKLEQQKRTGRRSR